MLPNDDESVFATEMKRLLGLVVAAVFAFACGPHYMPAMPVTPSPTGGMQFDVTATEKDQAATMHVGQTLEVVLHGGTHFTYSQMRSSDPAILEPVVDTGATAVRGVTLGGFQAMTPGQVEVSAVGSPVCPSGAACPMLAMLYTLRVTITPS
jgi:hypothetical protein